MQARPRPPCALLRDVVLPLVERGLEDEVLKLPVDDVELIGVQDAILVESATGDFAEILNSSATSPLPFRSTFTFGTRRTAETRPPDRS